jgi:hypothetical protein
MLWRQPVHVQAQVQQHVYRLRLGSDHHAPQLAQQRGHPRQQHGQLWAHAHRPLVLLWRQLLML